MSKAYIIGTGPGDEELLTLKGKRVLKECTAVLYDRLVSNNILNYLNDDCEIYYCGKEPGAHYKTQEEINKSIVELAKKGHIVGRIKGGDPYVFGRGGEEVLALREENIEFEVIPGVTSPIAVLNYAGIPITHRGIAQSFHIVTGMSAKDLNVNFSALAKEHGTLVFMMALSNIDSICEELIKNGKDINTPAAVVMRGTSSKQKKVIGTLENIIDKAREAKLKSPCIIVIGDVVKLSESLSWYENKPLFGKNICITRSKEQAKGIKEKLKNLGAEVTEINSIKVENKSEALDLYKDKLETYDHIILSSVNGVNIFFDYLIQNEIDIRNIKADFSVVGKATKKALKNRGIIAAKMGKEFVAEGLFKEIKDDIKENDKVLILSSEKGRNFLKDEISKITQNVDRVNIYDVVEGTLKNEKAFEEVDIILFTSPSTVNNMIEMVSLDKLKQKQCVAIGPITLKALNDKGIDALVCKEHSEDGFISEVLEMLKEV